MSKEKTTLYKNGAIILRLVLGIISIVISVIVIFQSCAAGLGEALSDADSTSGAGGVFTGLLLLAGGIVSIAARKTKGGTIAAIILYALGAILAFANLSSMFGDLIVWAIVSLIWAVLLIITLFMKNKDVNISDNTDNQK